MKNLMKNSGKVSEMMDLREVFAGWKTLPPKFKYPAFIFIIASLVVIAHSNKIIILIFAGFTLVVLFLTVFQERLQKRLNQKAKEYDELQSILKHLADPNARSVEQISSIVTKLIEGMLNHLEDRKVAEQQWDRLKQLLEKSIQNQENTSTLSVIWKNVKTYLENHQKQLVEKAVENVLKQNRWLERNRKEFEENVYEHLRWILKTANDAAALKIESIPVPNQAELVLHNFAVEIYIYRDALGAIKEEVKNVQDELSPRTKEILLLCLDHLIQVYP